jgi:hypothetical protein
VRAGAHGPAPCPREPTVPALVSSRPQPLPPAPSPPSSSASAAVVVVMAAVQLAPRALAPHPAGAPAGPGARRAALSRGRVAGPAVDAFHRLGLPFADLLRSAVAHG